MRNILIAAAVTLTAAAVVASPLNKDRALVIMHDRHEGMETVGKANKAANREFGGSAPNLAVVRASAAQIKDLSRKASGWFPAGTGPEVAKTRAKAEIWQNGPDFAVRLHNFQVAATAFNAAAAGSDVSAMKARFNDMGGTCKACHDKYRAEEKH